MFCFQFSDGRDVMPISFLCTFMPKLSWTDIINLCRNPQTQQTEPLAQWSPITSEVLCRLLHLLLSLGMIKDCCLRLGIKQNIPQIYNCMFSFKRVSFLVNFYVLCVWCYFELFCVMDINHLFPSAYTQIKSPLSQFVSICL